MSTEIRYLLLGDNCWHRSDDLYFAIQGWLKDVDYSPTAKKALLVKVEGESEDGKLTAYVDDFGRIHYAQDATYEEQEVELESPELRGLIARAKDAQAAWKDAKFALEYAIRHTVPSWDD